MSTYQNTTWMDGQIGTRSYIMMATYRNSIELHKSGDVGRADHNTIRHISVVPSIVRWVSVSDALSITDNRGSPDFLYASALTLAPDSG